MTRVPAYGEPIPLAELAEVFGGFVARPAPARPEDAGVWAPGPGELERGARGSAERRKRQMRERWLPYVVAGRTAVQEIWSGGTGRRPV